MQIELVKNLFSDLNQSIRAFGFVEDCAICPGSDGYYVALAHGVFLSRFFLQLIIIRRE